MFLGAVFLLLAIVGGIAFGIYQKIQSSRIRIPLSVNYHFTRKCNYECGFCFHTAKTSDIASLQNAKRGLALLKDAGMKKLNFAGGEPLLYPKWLGNILVFCKEELHLESVSIVTNGSHLTEKFIIEYGKYIDIIAVSCDSFNEETNILIGRGKGTHVQNVKEISRLCLQYGIKFKVNTVINRFNFDEDMNKQIQEIKPFRWKCFQVLVVPGENNSSSTLRDASKFLITDEEFQKFCDAHSHNNFFVPEPNNLMKNSYLILDEYMRFLDKDAGAEPSKSILEIGVNAALSGANWDEDSFVARGGIYDWSRPTVAENKSSCGTGMGDLSW